MVQEIGEKQSEPAYTIYGVTPSYFTQKGIALLRFKELTFQFRWKDVTVREELEKRAGSRLIPVVVTGEGEYLWDTTPIAFFLDERYPEGQMLPQTPRQRIVARVLEDYLDEWVTRMVIHFRWFNEEDTLASGVAMARELVGVTADEDDLTHEERAQIEGVLAGMITWGRKTCGDVGAGEDQMQQIHAEFARFLTCLEMHFRENDFLLGSRPSLGDFTLWGGLEAHFLFDPTPRALIESVAPALLAFHDRMQKTTCSNPGEWMADDKLPDMLMPLLQLVGSTFMKWLPHNRRALETEATTFDVDLGSGPISFKPRKYSEKCRAEIAAEIAALSDDDRASVEAILCPVGCWAAYQG